MEADDVGHTDLEGADVQADPQNERNTSEEAVRVEEGAMPAVFGLRKTHHLQNARHRFREWFVTGASGFTDEGLCSRRGGTNIVRRRWASGLGFRRDEVGWTSMI